MLHEWSCWRFGFRIRISYISRWYITNVWSYFSHYRTLKMCLCRAETSKVTKIRKTVFFNSKESFCQHVARMPISNKNQNYGMSIWHNALAMDTLLELTPRQCHFCDNLERKHFHFSYGNRSLLKKMLDREILTIYLGTKHFRFFYHIMYH